MNEVPDKYLVGLRKRNTENVQDKVIGISLRCRDQFKPGVVCEVLGKAIQRNARFALTDRLEVHLDHARMPARNDREKTKGRPLNMLSVIKSLIVLVKAAFLCLGHTLNIAMAQVNVDPKYKSYRDGYGLKKFIEGFLEASGVNLNNSVGF